MASVEQTPFQHMPFKLTPARRTPFQGVGNIVRFNWHFFVFGALGIALLVSFSAWSPLAPINRVALLLALSATLSILISLGVSWYVYDYSPLYEMRWLDSLSLPATPALVNIHAGFDESSALIRDHFPSASLKVLDFYDPVKHTEVSIRRARRAYPAFPGTETISTANAVFPQTSKDAIFLILAAHEIRNNAERISFFRQLAAALKPGGCILVVEHLRDWRNFLAYNIGFLHFHSPAAWKATFSGAGLTVTNTRKITPFLSLFILTDNGNPG